MTRCHARLVMAGVAVTGAVGETLGWLLASVLTGPDSWRHDISAMSSVGGDHAWLVLAGDAGLTTAVLALAALVHGSARLRGDHATVGVLLLVAAVPWLGMQTLARLGGPLDAVHNPSAVLALLALAGAALALSLPFTSAGEVRLAHASLAAGCLGLTLFAASLAPGLVGGLSQRGAALVLAGWTATAALRLARG